MSRKSSTETLIAAMRILARDIQSADGVANAAIAEAADRLEELHADHLRDATKMAEQQARLADLEAQAAIERRAVDAGRSPYGGRLTGDSVAQDPSTAPEPATVAVDAVALEAIAARLERISSLTQSHGLLWWQVEARKALHDVRRLLAGGE